MPFKKLIEINQSRLIKQVISLQSRIIYLKFIFKEKKLLSFEDKSFAEILSFRKSAIHADQELDVVSCTFHSLQQEFHCFLGSHVGHQFSQNPDTLHFFFVHQ